MRGNTLTRSLTNPSRRTRATGGYRGVEPLEARRLLSTVVVNTTVDALFPPNTGKLSLRNAIALANASTSATTITFDSTVFATHQTLTLNGNQLELSGNTTTTITAPAAGLTVSGNNQSRVFQVDSSTTATFNGFTITQGNAPSNNGGGIYSYYGTLTLNNVIVSENSAGTGGGIYNYRGKMTLTNCVVSNNTSPRDCGIISYDATTTMTNVTVSGNKSTNAYAALSLDYGTSNLSNITVSGNGGNGVAFYGSTDSLVNATIANNNATDSGSGGGLYVGNSATANIDNVTIAGNTAQLGGGAWVENGSSLTIGNTIIAGNYNTSGGTGPDVYGNFNSIGNNLIGKIDGSIGFNGADLTGTVTKPLSAKLGSLADNGGPTQTLLPQSGSPAIDAGYNGYVPSGVAKDQRGLTRIVNGTVDIGAVEVQSGTSTATITLAAPAAQTATAGTSKSFTLGSFTATNTTSPYTVTVDWGDGSAKTTFSVTTPGTIPAQSHTYASAGSKTASVVIKDSASHTSNTATFAVTVSGTSDSGSIAGTVFDDADGDGVNDPTEGGIKDVVVYNDANNNSAKDPGEATATTASDGTYKITGLAAGTYKIRQVLPTGYTQTLPTNNTGIQVVLTAGQAATGKLFGDKPVAANTAGISGTVFGDADKDGKFDANEFGLGAWTVFLDADKDGTLDPDEKSVTTDADGKFSFAGLAAGTYSVRVVQRSGATSSTGAAQSITLTAGQTVAGTLFGEKRV